MKRTSLSAVLLAALLSISPASAEILIKSGETIGFLGDSITRNGNYYPNGYIHLVVDGLKRSGVEIKFIPAGIGGHKAPNMLARLNRDVLDKKPEWMTLSCGVNDVWHGAQGVPLEQYKRDITTIVDRATEAGVKVILFTATMIGEDQSNDNNQKLIAYNEFLRELAKERNLPLADLNADMIALLEDPEYADIKGHKLTVDGVHVNDAGNRMMARGILRAMGVPEADIQAADAEWVKRPHSTTINFNFTVDEYRILEKKAKEAGFSSPNAYVEDLAKRFIQESAE